MISVEGCRRRSGTDAAGSSVLIAGVNLFALATVIDALLGIPLPIAIVLSAGFVLIPHLGLQSSFVEISKVGAIGGIAVAALALLHHTRRRALIGTLA